MKTFRYRILSFAAVCGLLPGLSCTHEILPEGAAAEAAQAAERPFRFVITQEPPAAKSLIPDEMTGKVRSLVLFFVDEAEPLRWRSVFCEGEACSGAISVTLPEGRNYTVYALANMGDIRPAACDGGRLNLAGFSYTVPSYSSIVEGGIPMCAQMRFTALQLGLPGDKQITLERLMARVSVTVDHSGITGGLDGVGISNSAVHLRGVARTLYPFEENLSMRRARSASELFPGDADYEAFASSSAMDNLSETLVFYIPENRQGTLPSDLCSFVEFTAVKEGSSDGVAGDYTYRFFIGTSGAGTPFRTVDFDVIRNHSYTARLRLLWDGLFLEGEWEVESENRADARRVAWFDADGTPLTHFKLNKKSSGTVYAHFDANGGSGSDMGSRKDLESFPYGWKIVFNGSARLDSPEGVPQDVDTGIRATYLGETLLPGGKTASAFLFSTDADALVTTRPRGAAHSIVLSTVDGRRSAALSFDVDQAPFAYRWAGDAAPDHMAQRGVLEALDADTRAVDPQGVFHLADGYASRVRLRDNGDGTAVVELIDGFASVSEAIYIEDADGERNCSVPLESRVPFFTCSDLSPATNYIDAQGTMNFAYLRATDSGGRSDVRMKVTDNGIGSSAVCAGDRLDLALVDELFPPAMESAAGRLGFDRKLSADGSFTLYTHVHTYEGVAALISPAKTFTLDSGTVRMAGRDSQGAKNLSFVSWNPWWLWYQGGSIVHTGGVLNDYTLYHEPKGCRGNAAQSGWEPSPANRPAETALYSAQIPNAVISRPDNLKLDAFFQDGAGYVGNKVATGTPGIVSPDYTETTLYQLRARLTDTADWDWETFGEYLVYERGYFIPGDVWMNPAASEADRRAALAACFRSAAVNGRAMSPYCRSAAEAWSYAPEGVTASSPAAVRGVEFFLDSRTISSTWTLTCTMNNLEESDIASHNAGRLNVVMQLVNPYNSASPTLECVVARASVRLHLYVWPAVHEVLVTQPAYHDNFIVGWVYTTFPYCHTKGKTIPALERYGFWDKEVLLPATGTQTGISSTFLRGTGSGTGKISNYLNQSGSAAWQFYRNDAFSSTDTDTRRRSRLMDALSGTGAVVPYVFRNAAAQTRTEFDVERQMLIGGSWVDNYRSVTYGGLDSILGAGTYYRQDDKTLYYDPTGAAGTYTHATEGKLFCFHLGADGVRSCYYFDPSFGFGE